MEPWEAEEGEGRDWIDHHTSDAIDLHAKAIGKLSHEVIHVWLACGPKTCQLLQSWNRQTGNLPKERRLPASPSIGAAKTDKIESATSVPALAPPFSKTALWPHDQRLR